MNGLMVGLCAWLLLATTIVGLILGTRDLRRLLAGKRREQSAVQVEEQMPAVLADILDEETALFEQAITDACALTRPEPEPTPPKIRPAVPPRAVGRATVRRRVDPFARIVNAERELDCDLDELLDRIGSLYLIGGDQR